MTVSVNGSEIGRINKFHMTEGSDVQTPEWINAPATVNPAVFNRTLTQLNYIFRLTDSQRYVLEKALRNHTTVRLLDTFYGQIDADMWVTSIQVTWDSNDFNLPWVVTSTFIGVIR